jgi:hypothetical protein
MQIDRYQHGRTPSSALGVFFVNETAPAPALAPAPAPAPAPVLIQEPIYVAPSVEQVYYGNYWEGTYYEYVDAPSSGQDFSIG